MEEDEMLEEEETLEGGDMRRGGDIRRGGYIRRGGTHTFSENNVIIIIVMRQLTSNTFFTIEA